MRKTKRGIAACFLAALLNGCGGGGSGGSATPAPTPAPSASPSPTPSPSQAACSLRGRQDWALAQLQEWYLFPNLLDTTVSPAAHSTVQSYIDALVAPARAQNRDRYFTYLTSIAEENAYYEQGASAGFGVRLALDAAARRLYVIESFEGGPALGSGVDRGTEILSIGTTGSNLRSVSSILASGGGEALTEALGPDTPGVTRAFQVRDQSGVERTTNLAKREFVLDPVSDRYGAKIIADGARRVGYLRLRTFIDTAEPDLRAAFASFKAQGVTELIIDLRYNGGGLISVGELLGNLMAEGRGGQVFQYIAFRDSKAIENETSTFQIQPESIAPTKVAFIGDGSTASASEMVINGFVPYLGTNMALVGANTYGKPVGQIALDNPGCDDRLRAVALQIQNANRQGEYYSGLAATVPVTCSANDDYRFQLGDPDEPMIRGALNYLAGRSCTPIGASAGASAAAGVRVGTPARREALVPERPRSTFEREVPGAF
jgi:C-terminal processing protease CtpA/Prc